MPVDEFDKKAAGAPQKSGEQNRPLTRPGALPNSTGHFFIIAGFLFLGKRRKIRVWESAFLKKAARRDFGLRLNPPYKCADSKHDKGEFFPAGGSGDQGMVYRGERHAGTAVAFGRGGE
jgi:hypothetical protein